MDYIYPAEEEIPLPKITLPPISNPIIANKKLEIDENKSKYSVSNIIYKNGAYFQRTDSQLFLPNGEKFKGIINNDIENLSSLKIGNYYWPNGQSYCGQFNENNNFNTFDGNIASLNFPNGDNFKGNFENGEIGYGKYITKDGIEIETDFAGGKMDGIINLKIPKKDFVFNGLIIDDKKEGPCYIEVSIKNKIYSIKGEYVNGLKDGVFTISEISPNKDNLKIKGKYKKGKRHGYFDIIDRENGKNINHKYISVFNTNLLNTYNKEYKEHLTGNENSISLTCRNNPINQLTKLVQIRLGNLLTLDISRSKINSISFLNIEDKTLFSLQNLILSNNNIKDLGPLENVYYPKLKKLIANGNQIKDVTCVSNFKFNELEELKLSSNPIESLEGIDQWKFPNLLFLDLSRTQISGIKPLTKADFPNLIQIDLYKTKINPSIKITTENFKKCTSLKKIIFDRSH